MYPAFFMFMVFVSLSNVKIECVDNDYLDNHGATRSSLLYSEISTASKQKKKVSVDSYFTTCCWTTFNLTSKQKKIGLS